MTELPITTTLDTTRIVDPLSKIVLRGKTEEVICIDKKGFHYRGQFIADAGEAHQLMIKFLRQNTKPAPEYSSDKELLKLDSQETRND